MLAYGPKLRLSIFPSFSILRPVTRLNSSIRRNMEGGGSNLSHIQTEQPLSGSADPDNGVKPSRLKVKTLFDPPPNVEKTFFKSTLTGDIAIWLYKKLNKISYENREHAEVEIRVGHLKHPNGSTKESALYVSEGILDPDYAKKLSFQSRTSLDDFETAQRNISLLRSKNPPTITQEQTVDRLYNLKGFSSGVRVTTLPDGTLAPPISKKKVAELFISLPSHNLDFKISIAVEEPVSLVRLAKAGLELSHERLKRANNTRHKDRKTYGFEDYQVCFTQVGAKYELEVELDQAKLLEKFRKAKRKSAPDVKLIAWQQLEQFVESSIHAGTILTTLSPSEQDAVDHN